MLTCSMTNILYCSSCLCKNGWIFRRKMLKCFSRFEYGTMMATRWWAEHQSGVQLPPTITCVFLFSNCSIDVASCRGFRTPTIDAWNHETCDTSSIDLDAWDHQFQFRFSIVHPMHHTPDLIIHPIIHPGHHISDHTPDNTHDHTPDLITHPIIRPITRSYKV